jgi:hypothetical protein
LVLPAWLALIVQVPTAVKLTVEPAIEQTAALVPSMENVTALPDAPPVAVTEYVLPPTVALLGAVDVNVIVCVPCATVTLPLAALVAVQLW